MDMTILGRAARVFEGPTSPADPSALATLNEQVADVDLAAPPVVLPDFHHKSNMEMPSSVAVATRDTVRPALTSASVNCGMALIALDSDVPDERGIGEFYRAVRERYPFPPSGRRELTVSEARRAASDGAVFAATRHGLPAETLTRVEELGRIDLNRYGGARRLHRELPALAYQLARTRFGTIGPSNHFIELQRVEEVFDHRVAEALGVRPGQLTLQYHGGGGVLAGEVGALFGRRRHCPQKIRLAMTVQKPLFHLTTARSYRQFRERLRLYFGQGCPAVALSTDEGQRLMLANAAAMNYGFAFRLTAFAALRSLAARAFGGAEGRLVVDSPHNSIYEEPSDSAGQSVIVHRHNACRAFPSDLAPKESVFASTGQAVLLPGTNRTSSYLAVAGPNARVSLYSACHGAGTLVSDFASRGLSHLHPEGHTTLRFRYNDAAPTVVPHLDDMGVNAARDVLVEHGIIRPVARMRPLAVLN